MNTINTVQYSCLCQGPYAPLPKIVQTFKTRHRPANRASRGPADCDEKCPECQLDTELGAHEAVSAIHCAPDDLITYEVLEGAFVGLVRRAGTSARWEWDAVWSEGFRAVFVWRRKVSLDRLASRLLREFGGDAAVSALRGIAREALDVLVVDVELGHVGELTYERPGFTVQDLRTAVDDIAGVAELEGFQCTDAS
ncbi:hypothetical protein F4779DRAFT_611045 [Xylariaceae sp. FL0662B]|nr:hypothetical protein F4779DRAFT_611045 [Xylariaceae sp. FL0662B]